MNKYAKVKKYYDSGLWDITRVKNAVVKEWITADEFKEITGMDYSE
ncbi:MAG: XkdX family protein [Bacteroidaceae bacterium]|nr:XkdX family protein [Bacteroidaceae bacterium]